MALEGRMIGARRLVRACLFKVITFERRIVGVHLILVMPNLRLHVVLDRLNMKEHHKSRWWQYQSHLFFWVDWLHYSSFSYARSFAGIRPCFSHENVSVCSGVWDCGWVSFMCPIVLEGNVVACGRLYRSMGACHCDWVGECVWECSGQLGS